MPTGAASKAEMEEMLRQGYSMQEVLDHFMKHGKTEEEEQKALAQRLQVRAKILLDAEAGILHAGGPGTPHETWQNRGGGTKGSGTAAPGRHCNAIRC